MAEKVPIDLSQLRALANRPDTARNLFWIQMRRRSNKEPPVQEVASCAPWKGCKPDYGVIEKKELLMNNIVYIVGAVVIVVAILSFLGFG
ncbi:MAG: hypothetical protein ACQEW7_06345 [Pseudomonadota bacterium]